MDSIINVCFLCTKDYDCVSVNDQIVFQVEYLFPEITIIKLGVSLRICPTCDWALCAFSKFKQSSVESSRRLEASIKEAQSRSLHTGSPPVVDYNKTSDAKPEKMEKIFIMAENMQEPPLDTQMHTDRASLNPITLVETIIAEPQIQLHNKDRVSQNLQQHTNTNTDNIEEISIKEEQMEETPQGKKLYNKILKEEYVSNPSNDYTDSQPKHNAEDESATFNTSAEVWEGSSTDFKEKTVEETDGNWNKNIQTDTKKITNKTKHQNKLNMELQEEKDFRCGVCGKSFTLKNNLKYHMKIHSDVKDFRCDTCGKSFTQKSNLKSHLKIHTGIKDFRCEVCNKLFMSKKSLLSHMKVIHYGIKEFHCDICNKSFTRKNNFNSHRKTHTGIKEFRCEICEKSYAQKSNLDYHMKLHLGVKDFRCDICDKSFTQKSNLNCHMKIHTDVKEFQCDVCDKSFTYKSSFTYHMKLHSGVKDFRCDVCDKLFTQKADLNRHMKVHSDVKKFRCGVCDKSFNFKAGLIYHMKLHCGIKEQCNVCDKLFTQKADLNRHMKVHSDVKMNSV